MSVTCDITYDITYDIQLLCLTIKKEAITITSSHNYLESDLLEFARMIVSGHKGKFSVSSNGGGDGYSNLTYDGFNQTVEIEHNTGHCESTIILPVEYFKQFANEIIVDSILLENNPSYKTEITHE